MSKQSKQIIDEIQKNRKKMGQFGVRKLGLFGSFARGDASRKSDLDFVVEFEKKSFDAYMDLKFFLEDLFDRPVDLVLTDGIKPRLRSAILGEAIHAPGF